MNVISLKAVGNVSFSLLKRLAVPIAGELRAGTVVLPGRLDPEFAHDPSRGQYVSTQILERLSAEDFDEESRILGVAGVDLCIPILTFVFGEAHLGCCAAVMSTYRLRQEFYGLPPNPELLFERTLKEALHELGHTYGLRHCPDYECVMRSSNAVEEVDIKGSTLCRSCRRAVEEWLEGDIRLASN